MAKKAFYAYFQPKKICEKSHQVIVERNFIGNPSQSNINAYTFSHSNILFCLSLINVRYAEILISWLIWHRIVWYSLFHLYLSKRHMARTIKMRDWVYTGDINVWPLISYDFFHEFDTQRTHTPGSCKQYIHRYDIHKYIDERATKRHIQLKSDHFFVLSLSLSLALTTQTNRMVRCNRKIFSENIRFAHLLTSNRNVSVHHFEHCQCNENAEMSGDQSFWMAHYTIDNWMRQGKWCWR